jgi:hypothetical protein
MIQMGNRTVKQYLKKIAGDQLPNVVIPMKEQLPNVVIPMKEQLPNVVIPMKEQLPNVVIPMKEQLPNVVIPMKEQLPNVVIPMKEQLPNVVIPMKEQLPKVVIPMKEQLPGDDDDDDQPGAPPPVDTVKLHIEIDGQHRRINQNVWIKVPKGTTIEKLYKIVNEKTNAQFRFPRLMKGRFTLPFGNDKRVSYSMEHYEIVDGTNLHLTQRKGKDIGIWGPPANTNDSSFSSIIQSFPDYKFGWISEITNVLHPQECQKLIDTFGVQNASKDTYDETGDHKAVISSTMIESILGKDRVATIQKLSKGNKWIFRQVQARGYSIPFHTDDAPQTLHIRLNSDYAGGRLQYIDTCGNLRLVDDYTQCTIHGNTLVHGVTTLTSGIRYGLFYIFDDDDSCE